MATENCSGELRTFIKEVDEMNLTSNPTLDPSKPIYFFDILWNPGSRAPIYHFGYILNNVRKQISKESEIEKITRVPAKRLYLIAFPELNPNIPIEQLQATVL